jgi:hypothetical protein
MAPPASAINTLIPLVAQLYVSTAQILPNHRKPANTTVCNTLAIWGRLTPTPYQSLGVVSILEELVVGKFADVIYILRKLPGSL